MPRKPLTPAQKQAAAAYMRDYRAREGNRDYGRSRELKPTDRQKLILRLYMDPNHGGTYGRVAEILGISESAVHNQLGRLMARLNVHSPSQAIFRLYIEGKHDQEE